MLLNLKYNNLIKILKNDGVGVIPTDTLYGLVGSAFSQKAINRIYKLKNRDKKKKLIILISSINDLKKFNVKHPYILQFVSMTKLWPGKNSIILPYGNGKNTLAFRLTKNKKLIEILKQTGPLVAPSANPEGLKPAENIIEAKKYFGDSIDFYLSGGSLKSKPSTLISINKKGEITALRGKIK
jgi:L-threonylcarbamoyladenylate synthase